MTFIDDINNILAQVSSIYGVVNGVRNTVNGVWNSVNNLDDIILGGVNSAINGIRNTVNSISSTVQNTINHAQTNIQNSVYAIEGNIKGTLNAAKNAISNEISSIESAIGNAFQSGVNTLRVVIESVVNSAKNEIASVINFANGLATSLERQLQNAIQAAINQATATAGQIANAVVNGIGSLASGIQNTVIQATNRAVALAQDVFNRVENAAVNAYNAAANWVGRAIDTANNAANNAYNSIRAYIQQQSDNLDQSFTRLRTWVTTDIINPAKNYINDLQVGWDEWVNDISRWLAILNTALGEGLGSFVNDVPLLLTRYKTIVEKALTNRYMSFDEMLNDIESLGVSIPTLTAALQALIAIPLLIHLLTSATGPIAANIQTLVATEARPANLSLQDSIAAFYRGMVDLDFVHTIGAKEGLPDDQIEVAIVTSQPKLDPTQLRDLLLRGEITEAFHDDQLRLYGLSDEQIKQTKVLYFFIPPPQDLITMAVREVFSPETAKKFGQFEDFPQVFADLAAQQGVSEQWAQNYWAMHWTLPSPQMGYDMLHRGIIDVNELKILLKALDIMPFWREKLVDLSYNTFTRVDTRRMYEMGVLDEAGVYKEYQAQGYDPERAKKLTEFTIRLAQEGDNPDDVKVKDLTRSVIETAYSIGEIDRQEAIRRYGLIGIRPDDGNLLLDIVDYKNTVEDNEKLQDKLLDKVRDMAVASYKRGSIGESELRDMLSAVGVQDAIISLYITTSDYETELELKEVSIEGLFARYRAGHVSEGDFRTNLSYLGFSSTEIDQAIVKADRAFDFRYRAPTQAKLLKWLKLDIINPAQYAKELQSLGYDDIHVGAFLLEIGIEPSEVL